MKYKIFLLALLSFISACASSPQNTFYLSEADIVQFEKDVDNALDGRVQAAEALETQPDRAIKLIEASDKFISSTLSRFFKVPHTQANVDNIFQAGKFLTDLNSNKELDNSSVLDLHRIGNKILDYARIKNQSDLDVQVMQLRKSKEETER